MESFNASNVKDYGVTGVSRSGRVRKRSSKLMDFQSPDEVDKKTKRSQTKQIFRQNTRGRPSASNGRTRRNTRKVAEDHSITDDGEQGNVADDDIALETALNDALIHVAQQSSNVLNLDGASDDDSLGELVADLVAAETPILQNDSTNPDSKVRKSIYISENKRKEGRMERKDKGKSRFTAYNVWAREFRKTPKYGKKQDSDINGSMKRLSELWSNVSNKEKRDWKRKAKLQATKAKTRGKTFQTSSSPITTSATLPVNGKNQQPTSYINRPTTNRTRKLVEEKQKSENIANASIGNAVSGSQSPIKQQRRSPRKTHISNAKSKDLPPPPTTATAAIDNNQTAVDNIEVVDVAAHLKLLGESLSVIGDRLKEHEGQIAVSGSLSVLLDSLLCSLGPLLCLANSLPVFEQNAKLKTSLSSTLDNIAYIMPGL